MGQITIAVTKRVAFRDSTQEFSNVYTYGSLALNPDASLATTLINEVVTKEKAFHSTAVAFVLGRCWSSGGSAAANAMIAEVGLSGVGSTSASTTMDRERAVLVQWPAGQDSKGRPVTLKKWWHCAGSFGSVGFGPTQQTNEASISAANRATIEGLADTLTRIGSSVWGLIGASGRERSGSGAPVAHRYLEHHQLGDQWRG